ncbi:MAG: sensor domain-containing diguanylate cyclase [Campylobacterota bacterium]|nr:sensor domain-containing diguanylate cyclase [Campylobacterota bacterium]
MKLTYNIWHIFYVILASAFVVFSILLFFSFENITKRHYTEMEYYSDLVSKTLNSKLHESEALLDLIGHELLIDMHYDAETSRKFLDNTESLFEAKLLRSEDKFWTLFNLSPVGMAIVDAKTGDFLNVNSSVLKSTGYTEEEFINLSYWDITPKKYEEQELQQIEDLKETGRFGPNQKEYIRKDGTRFPITISGVALIDTNDREIVLGIIEDISERKAYEKELEHLALYDPLTLLPNRRLMIERLDQEIVQAKREKYIFAILILDLDKFKQVNDMLGHNIGDVLLLETAQRINDVVHRNTDTVSRHGGDEFLILLSNIKKEGDALLIAKKICEALFKPFVIEGNTINISSSIGIAIYPEHGKDDDTLLRNADKALYKVKNAYGNNFRLFES